jgi:hypothetical protein
MVETALLVPGHPVVKAKPAPVERLGPAELGSCLCAFNRWVSENPLLASALIAGGYLLLRRRK